MKDYSQLKFLKIKKSQPQHPYFTSQSIDMIKKYISFFTKEGDVVLDPFCGTGTILYEAMNAGHNVIGVDANPLANIITRGKMDKDPLSQQAESAEAMQTSQGGNPENFTYIPVFVTPKG